MMRKPRHTVQIGMLALALLLAGCQDDSEQAEPSPTAGSEASTSAEPTQTDTSPGATSDLADAEGVANAADPMPYFFPDQPADWHVALEIVDGPITLTATEGVTLEVLHAWVSNLPEAPEDVIEEWPADDGPPVVFSLHVRGMNDTDKDIEWIRDPGLEIGDHSLSPHAWVGGWLPSSLPAGTTSPAVLVYPLPEDVSIDGVTSGEGRLEVRGVIATDTGEFLAEPLDLTFSWQPE